MVEVAFKFIMYGEVKNHSGSQVLLEASVNLTRADTFSVHVRQWLHL